MARFSSYKLVKTESGYDVTLYLDKAMVEFADESNNPDNNKNGHINDEAKDYLDKILPVLRINTVKIMYGALLVSYIAFSGSKASAAAATA